MRNLKLLLATTAILSMGAMGANAAADSVSTTLTAQILVYSPITISANGTGFMVFPHITTGGGKVVKINPNASIDESVTNAKIVGYHNRVEPIKVSGGYIGAEFLSDYNEAILEYKAVLDNPESSIEEKTLAQNSINNIGDSYNQNDGSFNGSYIAQLSSEKIILTEGSAANAKKCGEVTEITPSWRFTSENNGTLELRYGGTFTLDDNYTPTDGGATCSGQVTVTLLVL